MATGDVLIMPSGSGWIDERSNPFGIQGLWYVYGDQYGVPAKCVTVGLHPPSDCSEIISPEPPLLGLPGQEFFPTSFPNQGGVMCTAGATAVILQCMAGVTTEGCPDNDYENMWGAGIAVDLNADLGHLGLIRRAWDPSVYGFIGFSFSIDQVPEAPKLRVEVPVLLTDAEAAAVGLPSGSTSDDHPKGAPYWITIGTPQTFPPSAVTPGVNRVLFSEIKHPTGAIDLVSTPVTQRMLGIRFHTPAVAKGSSQKGAFAYCIRDFTLITQ